MCCLHTLTLLLAMDNTAYVLLAYLDLVAGNGQDSLRPRWLLAPSAASVLAVDDLRHVFAGHGHPGPCTRHLSCLALTKHAPNRTLPLYHA